ncbi:MAG: sulfurtransferase [Candidatus Thiodiazotropha sp. (ex. Lucinisca nassula)]|nr:sulfurtransferase [Candidatus Thiodiazotropha sp. (ex. Lucinisca nassula)]MBW9263001.1 sulfurtransferase [Candidatus Thiodiazotropha sp. (ex. Lucinisca nassula)]
MSLQLPLLVQPNDLQNHLNEQAPSLLLVDLCKASTYRELHIPGSVHLAYAAITASDHPTHGLLPEPEHLQQVFADHGIGNETHVVAYDDEGGGNASRLLWTLHAMGHRRYSLLDGGLHAWANEGHPCSRELSSIPTANFQATVDESAVASRAYILSRLDSPDLALWDARSRNEFRGLSRFSQFPGHIPGAVNLDWLEVMDRQRNLRLKPKAELEALLARLGITRDKEVITYCQTHHRSSLTWLVLRYLEFENCKGYPGSWSDWGNRNDTPKTMP